MDNAELIADLMEDIDDMENSKTQAYAQLMESITWYENRIAALTKLKSQLLNIESSNAKINK